MGSAATQGRWSPSVEVRTLLALALRPNARAPREARDALAQLPPRLWPELPALRLIVTELITNSVRHADLSSTRRIELTIDETRDGIRAEVKDPGTGREAVSKSLHRGPARPPRDEELPESGYGLLLVASLADHVGVRWEGGTVVWAELDRRGRTRNGLGPIR